MRTRLACSLTILALAAGSPAHADETKKVTVSLEEEVDWGFGAKVRRSHVSAGVQRLFVGDTPGSATQDGIGVEFVKRTKQVDLVIGVGFDRLDGRDGYYSEKDEDPTQPGNVDQYVFQELMWLTVEFTAVGHLPIHKILSIRYGAGLGIGIPRGEVRKTDAICTSDDLQRDCAEDPMAVDVNERVDLWPVLPVVNLLAGVELRPVKPIAIYADVGLHSAPHVAAGVTLFLW
jgi:hypothetical protein